MRSTTPPVNRDAEHHKTQHIGWLRAAVLGANDGIVSTASLLMGVAAAGATDRVLLTTGIAGLVAGAMSMAAGEYVSVHSQADTENADLAREQTELTASPTHERTELANIYIQRGLQPDLAIVVATQLMAHDAPGAHARDELGMSDTLKAQPLQAASASAASFSVGAMLPVAVAALAPASSVMPWLIGASLIFLSALGMVAARAGGANVWRSVWRVTFWGASAMAITAGVGALFGPAA